MSGAGSHSILAERIAAIPAAVAEAARAPLPGDEAAWRAWRGIARVVVTGGGLSEGPARVLCALLRRAGRDARFVSQADLLGPPAPRADLDGAGLILFSQGLAPNARLPLPWLGPGLLGDGAAVFARGLVVTAVRPAAPATPGVTGLCRRLVDAGHLAWVLPPEREDGLLLRVIGPAVALVAALRLADAITGTSGLAPSEARALELVRRGLGAPAHELFGEARRPIAIVAEPPLAELAMPLRWKLLEGLRVPDPPVWDPLQVAHGPLQSIYDEPATILCLRTAAPGYDELYARLRAVLPGDGRHRVLDVRAQAAGPEALLELDARLDAALLATLARHPMSLDDWPGRGQDGALYDVDPVLLGARRRS